MQPTKIEGANASPGAPKNWPTETQGECGQLPIRVFPPSAIHKGTLVQFCESAWTLSDAELAELVKGGQVILRVYGWQVPVMLSVEPRPEVPDVPTSKAEAPMPAPGV